MSVNLTPSRSPSGSPAFSPANRPVYRGGLWQVAFAIIRRWRPTAISVP